MRVGVGVEAGMGVENWGDGVRVGSGGMAATDGVGAGVEEEGGEGVRAGGVDVSEEGGIGREDEDAPGRLGDGADGTGGTGFWGLGGTAGLGMEGVVESGPTEEEDPLREDEELLREEVDPLRAGAGCPGVGGSGELGCLMPMRDEERAMDPGCVDCPANIPESRSSCVIMFWRAVPGAGVLRLCSMSSSVSPCAGAGIVA